MQILSGRSMSGYPIVFVNAEEDAPLGPGVSNASSTDGTDTLLETNRAKGRRAPTPRQVAASLRDDYPQYWRADAHAARHAANALSALVASAPSALKEAMQTQLIRERHAAYALPRSGAYTYAAEDSGGGATGGVPLPTEPSQDGAVGVGGTLLSKRSFDAKLCTVRTVARRRPQSARVVRDVNEFLRPSNNGNSVGGRGACGVNTARYLACGDHRTVPGVALGAATSAAASAVSQQALLQKKDCDDDELEAMLRQMGRPTAPYATASWRAGDIFYGGGDRRVMKVADFSTMTDRGPLSGIGFSFSRPAVDSPLLAADSVGAVPHAKGIAVDKAAGASRPMSAPSVRPPRAEGAARAFGSTSAIGCDAAPQGVASKPCRDEHGNADSEAAHAPVSPPQPSVALAPRPPSAPSPTAGGIPRGNTRSSMGRIIASHTALQAAGPHHTCSEGPRLPAPPSLPQDRLVRRRVPGVSLAGQASRVQARFSNVHLLDGGGRGDVMPPSIEAARATIAAAIGNHGTIASYLGFRDHYAKKHASKGGAMRSASVGRPRLRRAVAAEDDEEALTQLLVDDPERRYVLSDAGEARLRARAALRSHYRHRPYSLSSRYSDGGIAAVADSPRPTPRGVAQSATDTYSNSALREHVCYERCWRPYDLMEHTQHRHGPATAARVRGMPLDGPRPQMATHPASPRSTTGSVSPNRSAREAPPVRKNLQQRPSSAKTWRQRSVFDAYGP